MTSEFVAVVEVDALASEPVHTSLFDDPDPIPHTRLGQAADAVIVAPATARVIGAYAASALLAVMAIAVLLVMTALERRRRAT